jgi:hypothetical protein
MDHEGTPTLARAPGVDVEDYKQTLIERFSNPEVRDTIAPVRGELRPNPEAAAAGGPRPTRRRPRDQALGGRGGEPGTIRRGCRRAGRADRDRRPPEGAPDRAPPARGPAGLHRETRGLRGPRRRRALRGRLPLGPRVSSTSRARGPRSRHWSASLSAARAAGAPALPQPGGPQALVPVEEHLSLRYLAVCHAEEEPAADVVSTPLPLPRVVSRAPPNTRSFPASVSSSTSKWRLSQGSRTRSSQPLSSSRPDRSASARTRTSSPPTRRPG